MDLKTVLADAQQVGKLIPLVASVEGEIVAIGSVSSTIIAALHSVTSGSGLSSDDLKVKLDAADASVQPIADKATAEIAKIEEKLTTAAHTAPVETLPPAPPAPPEPVAAPGEPDTPPATPPADAAPAPVPEPEPPAVEPETPPADAAVDPSHGG